MRKINPCCLCGSNAIRIWHAVIGNGKYHPECEICHKYHLECEICHNCSPWKRTKRGACRAWNRMKRPTKILVKWIGAENDAKEV